MTYWKTNNLPFSLLTSLSSPDEPRYHLLIPSGLLVSVRQKSIYHPLAFHGASAANLGLELRLFDPDRNLVCKIHVLFCHGNSKVETSIS